MRFRHRFKRPARAFFMYGDGHYSPRTPPSATMGVVVTGAISEGKNIWLRNILSVKQLRRPASGRKRVRPKCGKHLQRRGHLLRPGLGDANQFTGHREHGRTQWRGRLQRQCHLTVASSTIASSTVGTTAGGNFSVGDPTYSMLTDTADSFYQNVRGFRSVTATGSSSDTAGDRVYLFDSAGDDMLDTTNLDFEPKPRETWRLRQFRGAGSIRRLANGPGGRTGSLQSHG